MLSIINLSVAVENQVVLHNITLQFQAGKTYVIMGPNGSGKSSLAATIMGHPNYTLQSGSIVCNDIDIAALSTFKRSVHGIFLAMQHPVEIQGLSVISFLKELCSKASGKPLSVSEVIEHVKPLLALVGLPISILERYVNVGFSGGEKKRFELLQMLIMRPRIVLLDELDSGVDLDGLKHLTQGLLWYRKHNPEAIIILITHYRHILSSIVAGEIHVIVDGSVVATGDMTLLNHLETHGYEQYAKRS